LKEKSMRIAHFEKGGVGRDADGPASPSLPEAFITLSERAGKPLWIAPDVAGLCCSTPWKSKGYPQGHWFMAKSIAEAMLRWNDGGKIPIVVDAASCILSLSQDIAPLLDGDTKARYESLSIIDSIAWCRDLLPKFDDSAEARSDRRAPNLLYHAPAIGRDAHADPGAFGRGGRSAHRHDLLWHGRRQRSPAS
jgi:hypothetical protein